MNDYVSKPVNPQTLAEALDRWLPREKQGDAALFLPSSPLTPDAELIFDRAGLMDRLMDDMDLAQVVIAAFLEDIPLQITALEGYLAAGDVTGAERQAHSIKGASANVGGEGLRGVASHMEKVGKAGDLDAVKSCMSALKREFERLKRAMMEGM
jgi:HPt (histidine-containing phosphotransfer) domain-containing protein